MTPTHWIIGIVVGWPIAAILVAIAWYRSRHTRRPTPSQNQPTVRAHKRLTADKPYDPGPPPTPRETAVLDQLREQLR